MKKEIIEAILMELGRHTEAYQSDSETFDTDNLDVNEQIGIDDISQKDQSTDISDDLQAQATALDNTASTLKSFLTVSRNDCTPGALVETDEMYMLVGVSLPPVHINNKKVLGVTEDAKIYPSIKGKKKGDTIQLGNEKYFILSVS